MHAEHTPADPVAGESRFTGCSPDLASEAWYPCGSDGSRASMGIDQHGRLDGVALGVSPRSPILGRAQWIIRPQHLKDVT